MAKISVNTIHESMVKKLNTLIFDLSNGNPAIKEDLTALGKQLNRITIAKLSKVNLDENLCNELVIAKNSSEDYVVAASRVNDIICGKTMLNDSEIIDIYHALYTHMAPLFIGVMHDSHFNIPDKKIEEMYGRCSLALLQYLNMQEHEVIKGVLRKYIYFHTVYYAHYQIRFSLRTISIEDYSRILNAVRDLEFSEPNNYVL
jgi:hypothetical protein